MINDISDNISILDIGDLLYVYNLRSFGKVNAFIDKINALIKSNNIDINILDKNKVPTYIKDIRLSDDSITFDRGYLSTYKYSKEILTLMYVKVFINKIGDLVYLYHNDKWYSIDINDYVNVLNNNLNYEEKIDVNIVNEYFKDKAYIGLNDLTFKLHISLYDLLNITNYNIDDLDSLELDSSINYLILDIPYKITNFITSLISNKIFFTSIERTKQTFISSRFKNDLLEKPIDDFIHADIRRLVFELRKIVDKLVNNFANNDIAINNVIVDRFNAEWSGIDIKYIIDDFPYLESLNNLFEVEFNKVILAYRKETININTTVSENTIYGLDKEKLINKINERIHN